MSEPRRTESVISEKAILVGVILPDQHDDQLEELQGLAESAGAEIVGRLTQRRDVPDVFGYLGKGKLEDLQALVEATGADVVIFDNDLTPAQTRNLEKTVGVKILDRTELILDIFASHAQTYEARLAVELAQLEYSLPRLKQMWSHLSRLKMGIGMRGPGEKQLEVDRRLVEKRIHDLRSDLDKVHRRKEREVAARREQRTVSLVGYTNAGKSTLMNRLTGAGVRAVDQLFATLDTRTRRWQLPNWGPVLLSDTVGFIRDLPHRLIASFKATLEEARQTDLLLHVADASNPSVVHQIAAVYKVLEEIGIQEKDTVLVLNKVDRLERREVLEPVLRRYPNAIPISAATGEGLGRLGLVVSDALTRSFRDIEVETDVGNGRLMAYLAAHGEVISRHYFDSRVVLHCRLPQALVGRLHEAGTVVRPRTAEAHAADGAGPVAPAGPSPSGSLGGAPMGDVA